MDKKMDTKRCAVTAARDFTETPLRERQTWQAVPVKRREKPESGVWWRALGVLLFGLFWTSWFWLRPVRHLWPWQDFYPWFDRTVLGWVDGGRYVRWVLRSYIFVGLPILGLWFAGFPPRALGMGRMADKGWRIVALAFVVAAPFLVWLGLRPGMHQYYAHMFRFDGYVPLLANALVIVVEHALIEGVLLTLALPKQHAWDAADPVRTGRLAWLGFGFVDGEPRNLSTWIGIPAEAWPALIAQALVFGLVHLGKDMGELVTAFPGGLGLGLLTYRIRSVWPSVMLHLGTGAVILATIALTRAA